MYNKQLDMTKKCTRCKQVLPVTEFHHSPCNNDGLQSHCKKCIIEGAKISAFLNGEKWYHKDGFMSEEDHFNAALEQYAQVFNMPQLLKYKTK